MIKIGYGAGHGYHTPGKRSPDGEREWSFNNKVARAFANELALYKGVITKRFDDPTGETDVPLIVRTNGANSWGADYYISFHHNALSCRWGTHTGVETYTFTYPSPQSVALANAIHPAVVKAYGLTNRGIKRANLHIVRETEMPSILIEGGFMDSTIDIVKLRNDEILANVGKSVAQSLARFLGLSKVAESEQETPVSTPSRPPVNSLTPTPVPTPSEKPSQSSTKLAVDGYWGPATTRALQRHYGTTVDGIISGQPRNPSTVNIPSARFGSGGSQLIRAMQKDLGTTVDGFISYPSLMIRALQRRFGTTQDGFISKPSQLVKAMQRALNNGTF